MKKINLILFSLCFIFSVSAQWTQFPGVPASANIECIRATDASNYYAGTTNAIFKTSDAGANWQTVLVNDMTGNIIPSIITDVYFLSATDAIAVGWIALGNSEVILRTTNGGLNWSYANVYNGGTYPREQNALDFSTATTGYSVGSNGRILKTNNSGTSWFQLSTGISTELFDVDFTGAATGYAVGNGKILRTTNGSTWSASTFTGKVFKAVHFPSAAVGYAAGESGVVYKTINSGTSWTQLTITDPNVNFTSVYFTDDNTGYITSDNYIYHTTTGGQYWERIQMPDDMNGITFFTAQDGLACGDDSQLYHTSNAGLPYKPQPNFSVSPTTLLCYDSTVNLTNLSNPNWTFEWLLNGVPFSTNFSASLVVPNSGTNVISLVAFNGFERDTLSKNILIQPSLDIDLSIGVVGEICAGTSGQVQVFNSQPGANYRLRNGLSSIGVQQAGNGGTLTFSTGNLNASTTLNIRATKSNTCGTNEVVEYVDVIVQNPDINKVIYAYPAAICPNLSTSVFLELSQNGVSYQLMDGTTTIGAVQTGNGATLSFPTPVLTANTSYVIRGTSSPLGCITNFPALTVAVEYPTLYFSPTTLNPEVNESIGFINNTVNPGGTSSWDFGPDATPQFITSQNVSAVQFGTTGIHAVTLTVTTLGGCVSQLTKQINVIDSVAPEACRIVHYAGNNNTGTGKLYALTRDEDRNLFTIYKHEDIDSLYIYSGNGDTILNNMVPILNYNEFYSLTKHNEKGVSMWSTQVRFATPWSRGGDVLTDSSGNVYMVYYHGDHSDDIRIYSADGRYFTFNPPFNGSNSSIIIKYDPNGMYLWHTIVSDTYVVDKISLKWDESGNLLYAGTYFYKIAPNGTILNTLLPNRTDSEADGQGGVYVCGSGFGFQYIGPGTGIPSPVISSSSNLNITTMYIQMDEDHNIYLAGKFSGEFVYNGVLYSDIYLSGSTHQDIFLCKINSDGSPGWFKQFKSDYANTIKGIDVKNGTLVLGMQTYGPTFTNVGGPVLTGLSGLRSDVLFKCDTDGNSANMILFQNGSSSYGTTHNLDLVYLNDDGTEVDFGFEYRYSFITPSGVSANAFPHPYYASVGIQLASVDCLFSIVEEPPVSAFTNASSVCTDTELTFTDGSTNVPSSWSWTFQNGTPAVSTDQNPEVSFSTPGTYTVTLTASNQYGVGTTVTQQVTVNEATANNNWISEDSLCYSDNGISIEAPMFTGGSYTYSNTSSIANNDEFFPSLSAIGEYTVITYNYTDPNVGCTGEATDSIFTIPLPTVNLTPFAEDTLCYENQGIPLGTASPAGGTFTDNYNSVITGNTIFPPANALSNTLEVYYSYTDPATGCAANDFAAIYLDECLGLTDLSVTEPQLATLVDGKQYQIIYTNMLLEGSVVDSKGQKVLNFKNEEIIDLEPFAPGMYFIRIVVGTSSYAFKVSRY